MESFEVPTGGKGRDQLGSKSDVFRPTLAVAHLQIGSCYLATPDCKDTEPCTSADGVLPKRRMDSGVVDDE